MNQTQHHKIFKNYELELHSLTSSFDVLFMFINFFSSSLPPREREREIIRQTILRCENTDEEVRMHTHVTACCLFETT